MRDEMNMKRIRLSGRHALLHQFECLLRRFGRRIHQSNPIAEAMHVRVNRENIHAAGERQHDRDGFDANAF